MTEQHTYHPVFCVSGAICSSIFCSSVRVEACQLKPRQGAARRNVGGNVPMSLMFHTPGAAIEDILGFFVSLASLPASTPSTAESTLESGSVMLDWGGVRCVVERG